MKYSNILAKFLIIFPEYQERICQWSPNNDNTINVKTHTGQSLMFTYYNDREWTLSSINTKNRRI